MAGIGILVVFLFLVPLVSHAAGTSVTVATDKSYYAGAATITVSGTVTPAPGVSGTNVAISITSPNGQLAGVNQFSVNSGTGAYSGTFVAGGALWSVNGTYTVSANYNGATATNQFQYGNVTTSSGSATTTTLIVSSIITQQTTVTVSGGAVTTTVVQAPVTTTVVQAQQTTVTQQIQTTVTESAASDTTGIVVGAIGVVIAIIAGALSVVALRRK